MLRHLVLLTAILAMTVEAQAQNDPKAERAKYAAEISQMLRERDSFVAIERIEADKDEKTVARRYFYLIVDLYSAKQVGDMATIGRAGMQYMLTHARAHAGNDEEAATWFLNLAQMSSFNLASNLWPGWGDEGVTVTAEQQAFGHDMAKLDLRLVQEMKLPPEKLSTATWIIGVHQLAARDYAKAKDTLAKAKEHAIKSGANDTPLMVEGYIAIAEILEGKMADMGRKRLAAAAKELDDLKTEDATFFKQQHQDVLKVLSKT
jgi:hypothetical protein